MQRGKSKCSSSKSPDRNPAMPSVSSCSLFRPSSNAQSGEVERSNPPAFRSLNGLLVAENRKPKKGFYSSCSKRREGSRTPNKNSNRYLKPGALAQLRDARINTRASSSCTAIGRKRVLVMDYGDKGNPGGGADGAAAGPLLLLSKDSKNHDLSPQKKILLTPKTPSTPVTPKTNSAPPLFEEGVQDPEVESRLESLPFDLLRLRKVVVVARQCYFNYTTPDRSRQEMLKMMTPRPDEHWPFVEGELSSGPLMRCPVTPKAPRHDQHRPPARLSVAEMKQISASLFQGPPSRFYRNRPPGLPVLALHEEDKWLNKKIQANIAKTYRRQSEALTRRRNTAKVTETSANTDNSNDDCDEINHGQAEVSRESTGGSHQIKGNIEVLVWGKGGARTNMRYGSVSGSNSKNARGMRVAKMVNYLLSKAREEDEKEFDIQFILLPVENDGSLPSLETPYVCCPPTVCVNHLCKLLALHLSLPAEDLEIVVEKQRNLIEPRGGGLQLWCCEGVCMLWQSTLWDLHCEIAMDTSNECERYISTERLILPDHHTTMAFQITFHVSTIN